MAAGAPLFLCGQADMRCFGSRHQKHKPNALASWYRADDSCHGWGRRVGSMPPSTRTCGAARLRSPATRSSQPLGTRSQDASTLQLGALTPRSRAKGAKVATSGSGVCGQLASPTLPSSRGTEKPRTRACSRSRCCKHTPPAPEEPTYNALSMDTSVPTASKRASTYDDSQSPASECPSRSAGTACRRPGGGQAPKLNALDMAWGHRAKHAHGGLRSREGRSERSRETTHE